MVLLKAHLYYPTTFKNMDDWTAQLNSGGQVDSMLYTLIDWVNRIIMISWSSDLAQ